jgi:hypothetical protein
LYILLIDDEGLYLHEMSNSIDHGRMTDVIPATICGVFFVGLWISVEIF